MTDALIRNETRKLQTQLASIIALVIKQHDMAKETIAKIDKKKALAVLEHDQKVDYLVLQFKADVEFLITKRPLGKELRRTLAYFEIANDLERIADYAKYIAKFILKTEVVKSSTQKRIRAIHKPFRNMLLEILDVVKEERVERAMQLVEMDDFVDNAVHKERTKIFNDVSKTTSEEATTEAIFAFSIINALERAGDHVVHICETVFYIATGEHGHDLD